MPDLYTVSFTTKKLVKMFDAKGNLTGEKQLDAPVTITALPLATALSYSKCDNYKRVSYQPDHRGVGNAEWAVPATKSPSKSFSENKKSKRSIPKEAPNALTKAAETGDLSAALNK